MRQQRAEGVVGRLLEFFLFTVLQLFRNNKLLSGIVSVRLALGKVAKVPPIPTPPAVQKPGSLYLSADKFHRA